MAVSIFDDKTKVPTLSELDKALGKTAALLKKIEQYLLNQIGEITHEWNFFGKQAGWTLAFVYKGRTVLHLIPRSGLFTVVFTLGKRAELASRGSNLLQISCLLCRALASTLKVSLFDSIRCHIYRRCRNCKTTCRNQDVYLALTHALILINTVNNHMHQTAAFR